MAQAIIPTINIKKYKEKLLKNHNDLLKETYIIGYSIGIPVIADQGICLGWQWLTKLSN